jgi:PAS domain S-box-containing protein
MSWLNSLTFLAGAALLALVLRQKKLELRLRRRLKNTDVQVELRNEELKEAYARLNAHLTQTPLAVIEWDSQFRVTMWTGQAETLFGWKAQEVMGRNPNQWNFVYPEDRAKTEEVMAELLGGIDRNISHNRNLTADGRVLECEWFNSVNRTPEGGVSSIFSLAQDVTARKKAQRELTALNQELEVRVEKRARQVTESEERFRGAFEAAAIGMALVTLSGRFSKVNDALCEIVGYPREELLRKTFQDITHPDDLDLDLSLVRKLASGDIPHYQLDKRYFHRSGRVVWIRLSASVVRDAQRRPLQYVAQIEDVTPQVEAQEALQRSLSQKELLLREVHHRVKNNLQIVTSLLQLQEGRLAASDSQAHKALNESRARVRAMALVHETLYCSDNLARIEMKNYIRRLCKSLLARERVLELDSNAWLPMSQAVPCGLIINELVSNCIKHAPDGRIIRVSLTERDDNLFLEVDDDGPGFGDDQSRDDDETLGLRLVRALVGQIFGTIDFLPPPGGRVRIEFPLQDESEKEPQSIR